MEPPNLPTLSLVLTAAARVAATAALFALAGGCASTVSYGGLPDLEGKPTATVYVVRPNVGMGSAISAPVYVNESLVGQIGPGGYLSTRVPVGTARVRSTTATVNVAAQAGVEYYFELTMPAQLWMTQPDFVVARVSREQAASVNADGMTASRGTEGRGASSAEGPAAAPVTPPSVLTASAIGEWTFGAERIAKSSSCSEQPIARLTGKGVGFETFAITCTSGDVLNVRCDRGQCRALR